MTTEAGLTKSHIGGLSRGVAAVAMMTLSAGVVALDQWTKQLAVTHLLENGVRSVPALGEHIRFTYVENRGAAFGLLQEQTTFFILVGLTVIGVILYSFRQVSRPSILLTLSLGLQLGGAIGNLIDRMRYGYVVDFMDLSVWPVFNVADSAIVCGVIGLAYTLAFPPQTSEATAGA
ncbi:MAG: signal peptidase II [Chloroflexota bacterium]